MVTRVELAVDKKLLTVRQEEVTGRQGKVVSSFWMVVKERDDAGIVRVHREHNGTQCLEKRLWEGLWTCHKTNYAMLDWCIWKWHESEPC